MCPQSTYHDIAQALLEVRREMHVSDALLSLAETQLQRLPSVISAYKPARKQCNRRARGRYTTTQLAVRYRRSPYLGIPLEDLGATSNEDGAREMVRGVVPRISFKMSRSVRLVAIRASSALDINIENEAMDQREALEITAGFYYNPREPRALSILGKRWTSWVLLQLVDALTLL